MLKLTLSLVLVPYFDRGPYFAFHNIYLFQLLQVSISGKALWRSFQTCFLSNSLIQMLSLEKDWSRDIITISFGLHFG